MVAKCPFIFSPRQREEKTCQQQKGKAASYVCAYVLRSSLIQEHLSFDPHKVGKRREDLRLTTTTQPKPRQNPFEGPFSNVSKENFFPSSPPPQKTLFVPQLVRFFRSFNGKMWMPNRRKTFFLQLFPLLQKYLFNTTKIKSYRTDIEMSTGQFEPFFLSCFFLDFLSKLLSPSITNTEKKESTKLFHTLLPSTVPVILLRIVV